MIFSNQLEEKPKPMVTLLPNVFPRLASVLCGFPALGASRVFCCALHWLCIFPRLAAPVLCFPAFGTGCIFSRAWRQSCVFLRFAMVVYFPALGTGFVFSRAWHRLCVCVFFWEGGPWYQSWTA